jgi:hypothetical protein
MTGSVCDSDASASISEVSSVSVMSPIGSATPRSSRTLGDGIGGEDVQGECRT